MADQVTISTFLELRDNLSEGLRNVAKSLEGATVRGRKAIDDQTKAAERAAKDQERIAARQAREKAKAVRAVDAMLREQERARERTQNNLMRAAERAAKQSAAAEKARQREYYADLNKRMNDIIAAEKRREREDARAQRAMAAASQKRAREQQKYEARLTAAIWREEQRRIMMAERVASREAAAAKRASDVAIREARRAAKEKERLAHRAATAQIKEAQRAARAERQKAAAQKKDSKDTVFGHLFGGMTAASVAANAITSIFNKAGSVISDFYQDAIETGARYEQQMSAISGAIFTHGLTKSVSEAKTQTTGLLQTIRSLAAKLPGEAQDYVKVFSLSLPTALAKGVTDTQKYAEMVSKYTAIAVQRGYKGQAGYQLNEILEGRVRVTTNMFNVLKPYMKMTAKEFRAVTDDSERLRIVFDAINKSAAALPAFALDANAIFGELKSQLEWLSVLGKAPLFESLKIAAVHLTELISGPAMSAFITNISTALGDLTVGAVVLFKQMFEGAYKFVNYVADLLNSIPGVKKLFGGFKGFRQYIDPFSYLMAIGAEEREKWRAKEALDVTRSDRPRPSFMRESDTPTAPTAPSARPIQNFDFRNSSFDIKQEFAEGFDPDRIAVAFSQDLGRVGEMKLQSGYAFTGMVP